MPRRAAAAIILIMAASAFLVVAMLGRQQESPADRWENVPVPQGTLRAAPTLQLQRFAYRHTSYTLEEVQLRVANRSDVPQRGVVWILLSPADAEEAWREAVWSSPEQAVSLLPGESADLTFAPPDAIKSGTYELSAWVHAYQGRERTHADGAGSPAPLYLGEPFDLRVIDIRQIEQIDGSVALEVTLEAANLSGATTAVSLSFEVVDAAAGGAPAYVSAAYATSLDQGETAAATLNATVRLPRGTYALHGVLRRQDDQSVVRRVAAAEILNIE